MASTTTIVAAFRDGADAQAAATDLQSAGVDRDSIYLESSSAGGSSDYGSRTSEHEGGIAGWFKSLFGAEDESETSGYERTIKEGGFLLSVDAQESQLATIEEIINRHSPVNVHDEASAGAKGVAAGAASGNASQVIPVVEEALQVGKRRVLRGGVRVYSRVTEQPVEESISLREERVRVDRHRVDRPVTQADLAAGREQVIEVEEFA